MQLEQKKCMAFYWQFYLLLIYCGFIGCAISVKQSADAQKAPAPEHLNVNTTLYYSHSVNPNWCSTVVLLMLLL